MANVNDYEKYLKNPILPDTVSTAELWEHQRIMLTFASSLRYCLLYSGMSTGKTLVALRYLEQFPGLRLVISPARPMNVYREDYEQFYTGKKPFDLIILNQGTIKEKAEQLLSLKGSNAVIVTNYEAAYKLPLDKVNISAAVLDEAHRIGIYNSTWSINLANLLSRVPRKMAMSGTPFHDARERLYGIYRFFDPITYRSKKTGDFVKTPYPKSTLFKGYNDFLENFCVTRPHGKIKLITGYKNTENLLALVRPTCLQIKTEDVIDLPELVIRRYKVPLAKATRAAYDSLKNDAIINFDNDESVLAPHILTRILRLQQLIASGELVTESGEKAIFDISARLDKLNMILEELGTEPVVIFTRFKRDVTLIKELLRVLSPGAGVSMLTGDCDEHEEWKQGKTRYLIANVDSGSEGVRLVRAQHVIIWSLGYSLKSYEQLIMRVRRYGQKASRVFVHILISENTVDEDILAAIERKSVTVNEMDKGLRESA